MNPYTEMQTRAVIEGLRLLRAIYITSPLSVPSDIRMACELLDVYAPSALTDNVEHMRHAYAALSEDHLSLMLDAIGSLRATVKTLRAMKECPFDEDFTRRLRMALDGAEREVGADIRAQTANSLRGIYVIVDPEATRGRPVAEVARQSLEGGARVIQLRDKLNDKGPMLEAAVELVEMCEEYDALFVMNDHADVARSANAHILHIGQTDLPVESARQTLSARQLIGNSNGSMEEAMHSNEQGVDYIAVGAIYRTTTMGKSGRTALGPQMITRVKNAVSKPIIAIGGIGKSNIAEVVSAGADSVCVVSAVTFAGDPRAAARELADIFEMASR